MQPHPNAAAPSSVPASHLAMLSLGCGLYLGWQTIGISPTLFPQPAPGTYELMSRWSYLSTLLVILALLLYAVFAWRAPKQLVHPRAAALGTGALVSLGTVLTMYSGWAHPTVHVAPLVAGQVLLAVKAVFIVLWGSLLCRIGLKNAFVCVAGTYVVGFCVCLVVAQLSPAGAIIVRCVLPLLSAWAYLVVASDTTAALACDNRILAPRRLHNVPWRLLVGIGLFGALIAFANHLSETKTYESTELYTLIAGLVVSLVLLAVAARTSANGRFDFTLLYRLITPLLIGCLMLTPILEPGNQQYEALAIGGAWALFRIFSWTLWCYIAIGASLEGGQVFALGHVAMMVLSTVAESICIVVPPATMPLTASASGIVLLTVLNSTLIMNEGTLAPVVKEAESVEEDPRRTTIALAPADPTADPELARLYVAQAARVHDLSEREQEIATLVLLGKTNAQISDEISVAGSTLRTHLRNIYGKAGVHIRQEMVELLARQKV